MMYGFLVYVYAFRFLFRRPLFDNDERMVSTRSMGININIYISRLGIG